MRAGEDPAQERPGETWVEVGRVGKTFGLRGEVVIHCFGEIPECFAPGSRVFLVTPDGLRPLRVAASRQMPKKLVARFEGWDRIEDVQPWVGCTLRVRARDLPPLEDGQFYYHELVGLQVYAADGRRLGILEEVLPTGANDVYCVREAGREILIPAIRDAIESIDLEARRMTLRNLEGLIEP